MVYMSQIWYVMVRWFETAKVPHRGGYGNFLSSFQLFLARNKPVSECLGRFGKHYVLTFLSEQHLTGCANYCHQRLLVICRKENASVHEMTVGRREEQNEYVTLIDNVEECVKMCCLVLVPDSKEAILLDRKLLRTK